METCKILMTKSQSQEQSFKAPICRYANTRGDKHWFAKPCRPFHEIVYAKQKGFPYWPAKVVNNKENSDGQVGSSLLGK